MTEKKNDSMKNAGSGRHRRLTGVAVGCLLLLAPGLWGQPPAMGVATLGQAQAITPTVTVAGSTATDRLVVVTLRSREMFLSQTVVKPGPVRFLLINHTTMDSPTLVFETLRNATVTGAPLQTSKPGDKDSGNTSWLDVTLSPGAYQISLSRSKQKPLVLTVTP